MTALKLFYRYPACSIVSHIALEEAGLPFEARRVDFQNADDMAEVKKFNPKGAVPTLVADGKGLSENVAICSYIDSLAPQAKLFPADPFTRAQCVSFLAWGASTVHINFRMSFRPERFTSDAAQVEAVRAQGRTNFWKNLETIDEILQKQDWVIGNAFTIADGYALRFWDWGRITKHPVEDLKAFTKHKDRMIARPAVKRVLEREDSPLVAKV